MGLGSFLDAIKIWVEGLISSLGLSGAWFGDVFGKYFSAHSFRSRAAIGRQPDLNWKIQLVLGHSRWDDWIDSRCTRVLWIGALAGRKASARYHRAVWQVCHADHK